MNKYLTKCLTLSCLLSIIVIAGCVTSNTTLYPIGTDDIQVIPKGTTCDVPEYVIQLEDGTRETVETHIFKAKKDGRYLSNLYLTEIVEVK